jgi:hypothetical protein
MSYCSINLLILAAIFGSNVQRMGLGPAIS